MANAFKDFFMRLFNGLFARKKNIRLGLYGPPNGGKTTLANRISMDWLGEEVGAVSDIAHETREIAVKEKVIIRRNGRSLTFNLIDTPGITTKVDYEDFVRLGMRENEARTRAKQATRGVIDSIKRLDEVDVVIVVMDATQDPYSQVNITIMGNLEARKIPVLIAANKIDLKKANIKALQSAFPKYKIIGISAKYGKNMEDLYSALFEMVK
jgi:hypothetical protein